VLQFKDAKQKALCLREVRIVSENTQCPQLMQVFEREKKTYFRFLKNKQLVCWM